MGEEDFIVDVGISAAASGDVGSTSTTVCVIRLAGVTLIPPFFFDYQKGNLQFGAFVDRWPRNRQDCV